MTMQGYTRLSAEQAQARYGMDTGAATRQLAGAFVVHDRMAVAEIMALANREGLKLWPISGGRNFGYGTAMPVADNSCILDLGALKAIRYNSASHSVTIEPGVNQQDLADFLTENKLPYLVPTTGLGPSGSLLGNALDGGYGLTPFTDHFESLSEVEGYWGNGKPFSQRYREQGCATLSESWPVGTGPSYMSLLRQGNFGVVTQATIRLARVPEASRVLIIEWSSEADFVDSQAEMSALVEDMPNIGGIISMNAERILSTQADVPLTDERLGTERMKYLQGLASERKIAPWTSVGTLYGSSALVKGAVKDIRRRLPKARVWAFSMPMIRTLAHLFDHLPKSLFPAWRRHMGALVNTMGTIEGRPIVAFLRIAYALDTTIPAMSAQRHPARDGQGILWYAPLVPLNSKALADYNREMAQVLHQYGFDNLLAVTTRSPRVLSGTIPLLFKKDDPEAVARAKACYRALVQQGYKLGMPPYRIGIDYMDEMYSPRRSHHSATLRSIKAVLDPNDIIAPGRYLESVAAIGSDSPFLAASADI